MIETPGLTITISAVGPSVEDRRRLRVARLSLERMARPRRPRWPWLVAAMTFVLGFLAGTHVHAAEIPVVALQVRPQIMLQRGDIRIEARVPRDGENRLLSIAWSSDVGSEGATLRQLEGNDALVLHTLWLPSQPAANYVFVATVFNRGGKPRGRAEARVLVPEGGDR